MCDDIVLIWASINDVEHCFIYLVTFGCSLLWNAYLSLLPTFWLDLLSVLLIYKSLKNIPVMETFGHNALRISSLFFSLFMSFDENKFLMLI